MLSPENTFILGSNNQKSRSRVTKTVLAWVFAFFWVFASSSCLTFVIGFYFTLMSVVP